MNRGSWEKVYSKTLPSSDSQTEGRARLGHGFPLIITLNTAVSFSLPPSFSTVSQLLHVCHSVSPSVCLSSSHSPFFFNASDAYNVDRAGVQKATERNTGNGQFEWSYHLFYNCWSNPISCFVLWLSGRNTTLGHWAIWLMFCCIAVWARTRP